MFEADFGCFYSLEACIVRNFKNLWKDHVQPDILPPNLVEIRLFSNCGTPEQMDLDIVDEIMEMPEKTLARFLSLLPKEITIKRILTSKLPFDSEESCQLFNLGQRVWLDAREELKVACEMGGMAWSWSLKSKGEFLVGFTTSSETWFSYEVFSF